MSVPDPYPNRCKVFWNWCCCIQEPEQSVTYAMAEAVVNGAFPALPKVYFDLLWIGLSEPCRTLRKETFMIVGDLEEKELPLGIGGEVIAAIATNAIEQYAEIYFCMTDTQDGCYPCNRRDYS